MKRLIVVIAVVSAATLFLSSDLIGGRGGRGGGGGGRGGGGVGGSRPAVGGGGVGVGDRGGGLGAGGGGRAPVGPGVGGGPVGGKPGVGTGGVGGAGKTPSAGQLGNFLDIGSPGAGPRPGTMPAGGPSAVGDFFQKGPGAGPPGGGGKIAGKTPGVGQGKGGQVAANRPNRVENRQQLSQNRQNRRQEIQNEFRDNHPRWDFAMEHPRWANWRVNAPYRWATAALLTGWCGYGNESYYDYGENIYYQEDVVYSDGQEIASSEKYASTAEQIATSIPEAKNPNWMPLGVFAMTQDSKASGPTPTMFVQLNVSKEGIIAGTLQNTGTNTTQPIEGMVDKNSQRAAWVVSGKSRPIMEAGVFNLTKDAAPALIHFEDGQTQQWLLVRMDEPKQ